MQAATGPLVGERMTSPAITVTSKHTLEQAMTLMIVEGIHGLPVVNEDDVLIGIVTDRDLRLFANSPLLEMTPDQRTDALGEHFISEVMRRQVITIHADATLLKATQLMRHNRIGGLPVVDQEKHVVGILTRSDLLDFLIEQLGPGHEEASPLQKEAV